MHCSLRLIVQTLVFNRSYLHRQVSPPQNLVVKGGNTWARNGRWILPENARLPRNIQGSFTFRKSTTWDKRLYFPSEGWRAEDFFALKNPTASAGFEPANLGTKGQHATSRPPKQLDMKVRIRGVLPPFPQTARWAIFCQNQTIYNSASPTSKRIMNLSLEERTKNSAASLWHEQIFLHHCRKW